MYSFEQNCNTKGPQCIKGASSSFIHNSTENDDTASFFKHYHHLRVASQFSLTAVLNQLYSFFCSQSHFSPSFWEEIVPCHIFRLPNFFWDSFLCPVRPYGWLGSFGTYRLGFSSQLLTLDSQKQLIIIWVATLIYDSIGARIVLEFSAQKFLY